MLISNFQTIEELNSAGADFIIGKLMGNQSKLLCTATGSSATGIYKTLALKKQGIDTAALNVIKLDEWANLPMDHPGSCEYYIHEHILQPLNIATGNFISFNSKAIEPASECKRIQEQLNAKGPIDICILGLGLNGHIAFNEPANELQPNVHLAKLSAESMAHAMVNDVADKPTHGYTLGIADILQSRTILLVVHGPHKKEIFQRLLSAKLSTQLPASFLWLHNNAHCYYCEN